MRHLEYIIDNEYDGKKVLHYLRGKMKFSARLVGTLKRVDNGIELNGQHIRTIDIMKSGDVLSVNIPDDAVSVESIDYPLDIVYEDDDVLVINKPAGLAMHPTHNHQGDTLANAVAAYLENSGGASSFRAVGRLDKGTSGLVLCAKNKYSAARLTGNFHKTYYAVASGDYKGSGTIDKPIYRPDAMKTLRAAGESGDRAVTHWTAICSDGKNTLLEVTLETGRTHQIRVHFSSEGTPLAGDDMYGSDDRRIARPALHCGKVTFTHPVTGGEMTFEAPFPEDFKSVIPKISSNRD